MISINWSGLGSALTIMGLIWGVGTATIAVIASDMGILVYSVISFLVASIGFVMVSMTSDESIEDYSP